MDINEKVLALVRASLAQRALSWAALVGATGLWVYASVDPLPLRLISAGAYTLGVWVPLLFKGD